MNWFKIIAVAAIASSFIQSSSAAPMPSVATMTIEGSIVKISWHPAKFIKGIRGMSGSLGNDRTIPAYYEVTLKGTKVTPTDGKGDVPFKSGELIKIKLNHPKDDKFLVQNMKVRIIGFDMSGDEGGWWTSFKKIEILGKNK